MMSSLKNDFKNNEIKYFHADFSKISNMEIKRERFLMSDKISEKIIFSAYFDFTDGSYVVVSAHNILNLFIKIQMVLNTIIGKFTMETDFSGLEG